MPSVTSADLARMRDQLFFDGPLAGSKSSRFWMLLPLSAVIAAAGVVADSTATVIGAMIVAPLMTPILGTALAVALGDWRNLRRSLLYVVLGAACVVGIGFLLGLVLAYHVTAANNTQVAGRVAPHLIDLLAALATGAVGAVALARSDISDTLPGVAIAISLVPPLAVVGLTLAGGHSHDAAGALLLFLTNVAAILFTGVVVLAIYRLVDHAEPAARRGRRWAVAVIVVLVLVLCVPLARISRVVGRTAATTEAVTAVVQTWLGGSTWKLERVEVRGDRIDVQLLGSGSTPSTVTLRQRLKAAGYGSDEVTLVEVPSTTVTLPPG